MGKSIRTDSGGTALVIEKEQPVRQIQTVDFRSEVVTPTAIAVLIGTFFTGMFAGILKSLQDFDNEFTALMVALIMAILHYLYYLVVPWIQKRPIDKQTHIGGVIFACSFLAVCALFVLVAITFSYSWFILIPMWCLFTGAGIFQFGRKELTYRSPIVTNHMSSAEADAYRVKMGVLPDQRLPQVHTEESALDVQEVSTDVASEWVSTEGIR